MTDKQRNEPVFWVIPIMVTLSSELTSVSRSSTFLQQSTQSRNSSPRSAVLLQDTRTIQIPNQIQTKNYTPLPFSDHLYFTILLALVLVSPQLRLTTNTMERMLSKYCDFRRDWPKAFKNNAQSWAQNWNKDGKAITEMCFCQRKLPILLCFSFVFF